MPMRVTYFVQQQSSKLGGWQMNFWNLGQSTGDVKPLADALAKLLYNVMGAQAFIPYYRLSDATTFRNVLAVYTNQNAQSPDADTDADYPATALQLKLQASAGANGVYKTIQWIRGIPDAIISNSGRYNPTTYFTSKLGPVLGALQNAGNAWAVNVLNRNVTPTPVTAFVNSTGFVTAPNHGLGAVGAIVPVRIKGAGQRNPLNGRWNVTIQDTNTVSINFWVPETVAIPITGKNPTIRKQAYTQVQIASATVGIISEHKTGRPTNLLGGRRRARAG
jgi:hypothetical protein